ncbi:Phosphomevalonate kinase [Pontiella desulfatans]|uniref:Phosphomevalonate kinase n=1 Tax=Pontiella desulfatans TaxID=2750659 RepID=A0A6C2U5V5_PONDE|nr:galactokinase family protein [Pontiella desulfatans]VGO15295.1 Phosphomevalonate kinase [Pontiella desulfatans]
MMDDTVVITTSAPGSLMLLGEHAVLHGYHALVGAINRRITVQLTQTETDFVRIFSILGEYQAPLNDLVDHSSFGFVIQAIRQQAEHIPTGFDLKIDSDFSSTIGFGSSAAVTVATHAALMAWIMGEEPHRETLFNQSLKTVHEVQKSGSGSDVAASVFGGMVGYTTAPEFHPLELSVPLTAVYCGYKTPTPEVILKVEQMRNEDPAKYERIYATIDASVMEAIDGLRNHDFPAFGEVLNRNQELMDEIGVNTPELQEIVSALQAAPDVFGAKISGSGLGDCAIGVGYADLAGLAYPVHRLEITSAGILYHG